MKSETYRNAESNLFAFLSPELHKLGFVAISNLRFIRNLEEAEQSLSFPLRIDKQGKSHFHCMVGARFQILCPLLDSWAIPHNPMIVSPIHVFQKLPIFHEWSFSNSIELSSHLSDVLGAIAIANERFLSQLTTVRSLITWLQMPNVLAIDALNPDQRISLLAAAMYTTGDPQLAIKFLKSSIQEAGEQPAKRTILMRALLLKFESR